MAVNPGKAVLGLLLGLGGHALAFAGGFVAARLTTPSPGGGFEDLANVVGTFILIEVLLVFAALGVGIGLMRRGRVDLGGGIIGGWLLGLAALLVLVQVNS
ncbi:hypothetical protein F4553_007405 [Allocatelliglobosispora scoriae]|uniref:Uncharacterized protein n=1 Tax=Allocatelliglobosispora scoriae TaxID=643052 RepID=A0A841C579_9ACTN|nr:hypothetical protein [Allocatelliglobosispora scoriae]MBB5873971.1 hypothetical protein [Allocatelliglobosispora scoriae]